jgi:type IV pilus assembly protein PilC
MSETNSTPFWKREIQLGGGINDKFKADFYRELGSLLESGIDLRRGIQLLIDEQEKERIAVKLQMISDMVIKGSALSDALRSLKEFTNYEIQSIRIGEETGRLVQVFNALTTFYNDKVKLKRQLISVFSYPSFVLLITFGVLYFMLNFVVPMFEDVFKQFGQDLPWLTKKIIALSEIFPLLFGYGLVGIIGISIYFYSQRKEIWFRSYSSKILLRLPVFGKLIKQIYLARFCQSMALLLEAKTPLVKALDLVQGMIHFYPLEQAIQEANAMVKKGNQLHEGLELSKLMDKRLISLLRIAEEINQLDQTFNRLNEQYNEDISHRTKLMGTIIEPAIIVLIGGIVGLIMVAMYLPMFNLSNVIK